MKDKFFIEVFLDGKKYNDFLSENPECLKTKLTEWYEDLKKDKDYSLFTRLRTLYKAKDFRKCNILFSEFYNWYLRQNKHCEYCHITQEEINQLFEYNKIEYTRGGRRGKNLEIDRKRPKDNYGSNLDNLVLCCYWCNNAKTDEFSVDEFRPVGIAIGNILRNRLKEIKND